MPMLGYPGRIPRLSLTLFHSRHDKSEESALDNLAWAYLASITSTEDNLNALDKAIAAYTASGYSLFRRYKLRISHVPSSMAMSTTPVYPLAVYAAMALSKAFYRCPLVGAIFWKRTRSFPLCGPGDRTSAKNRPTRFPCFQKMAPTSGQRYEMGWVYFGDIS
jgi:hypothetical protein